jgi:hypothetical protein
VRLVFGDLEEVHRIAQAIAHETLGAKDGIGEGDCQRRSVGAQRASRGDGLELDFTKRTKDSPNNNRYGFCWCLGLIV